MLTCVRFGRIGRLVMRVITHRQDVEVVAINDPFLDAEYMVRYLPHMWFLLLNVARHTFFAMIPRTVNTRVP